MPQTVNNLNNRGTVLVEHSDERLAAVEEAKRTGQEFQSIGAIGSEIVDRNALEAVVNEVSNANSSDPANPLPDYLAELTNNLSHDAEIELNQQKALEASEVSAEIVAAQEATAVSDYEKLRKDPKYFSKRIAEQNRRLAADYEASQVSYAEQVRDVNENASRERARIRVESIHDPNPATSLGKRAAEVPDISESATEAALQLKDRIIYGEESFKQQAKATRDVAPSDDRAVDAAKTEEPLRVEETTRKVRPPKE